MGKLLQQLDQAIREHLASRALSQFIGEADEKETSKAKNTPKPSGSSKPLPKELTQLRSILKKHEQEYKRIRLVNPLSNKLWQELETLRGKNIPHDLVRRLTPTEAKEYIRKNPNDIMFLVSGDGHLVSATSTNKWIMIPDTNDEKEQVPGDFSTLIIYPMKQSKSGIWQKRGGKKTVWERARVAYVVEGEAIKRL